MSAEPRPQFDIFDYHFYGAVSSRCAQLGKAAMIPVEQALSESWLGRADLANQFYSAQRDRFAPDAPIWVTETAQAACGGDAWAGDFRDTFRYVDQMARLARGGVSAVFHNTLAASDYALIDDATWTPRPNYWAALLWRRLMGVQVLDAGPLQQGLHVYAHCQRGAPGGVTVLAINLQKSPAKIRVTGPAELYALTAPGLQSRSVLLNGRSLTLGPADTLPAIQGKRLKRDLVTLAPLSVNFIALPNAKNLSCAS